MKKEIGLEVAQKTQEVLNIDPVSISEKQIRKYYQEFNNDEQLSMLGTAFHINQLKSGALKSIGDTYWGIKWDEFINLISAHGFKEGYSYEFDYQFHEGRPIVKEKAIIYYHSEKGLVLWATSYGEQDRINGGNVYGMFRHDEIVEFETKQPDPQYPWAGPYQEMIRTDRLQAAFDGIKNCHMTRDALNDINNGINFSYDVREGLFSTLTVIENYFTFDPKWNGKGSLLWFVDYAERKDPAYNHDAITEAKIMKCTEELQVILKPYIEERRRINETNGRRNKSNS